MPNLNDLLTTILQNQYFYIALIAWSLTWKGLALYKAARLEQKIWFVIILIVNTVGLLEIAYFFLLHKIDLQKKLNVFTKKTN